MTATFETLLEPGFDYCAEEIFSNLNLEDLKSCSLVSKKCNDIIFRQNVKPFKSSIDKMKKEYQEALESFGKACSCWIEVCEYFVNLRDFIKLSDFKEGFLKSNDGSMSHPNRCQDPIVEAILKNRIDFLKLLLESPVDFNVKEPRIENDHALRIIQEWNVPIFMAIADICKRPHNETFDLLLAHVEKKNISLEFSVKREFDDQTLNYGEVFNILDVAVNYKNFYATNEIVKFILKNPLKYRKILNYQFFANVCSTFGDQDPEFFKRLIKNAELLRLNLNQYSDNTLKKTGLHYLVSKQRPRVELIKFMVENAQKYGIEVDLKDKLDTTPFLMVCENRCAHQEKILEIFIKNKDLIDVNAKIDGKSALDLLIEKSMKCSTKSVLALAEILGQNPPSVEAAFENLLELCKLEPDDAIYFLLHQLHDIGQNLGQPALVGKPGKLTYQILLKHFCSLTPTCFYYQGNLLKRVLHLLGQVSH